MAHNEFLLYPTYSHPKESFKERYHDLFEESISSRPSEGVKMEYLARCEEITEVSDLEKLRRLSDYYIWTKEHVEKYFEDTKDRKVYVFILRVYELPELEIVEKSKGMSWVTLPNSISPQDCIPVLNNEEFERVKGEIKSILESPLLSQLEIECPQRVEVNDETTLRVTANGVPVEGANLLIGANSIGMTNRNGEISHVFSEAGSFTITVTKGGYASASANVEVQERGYEREHERLKEILKEIGETLNFIANKEKYSPNRTYRYDGTWRDSEGHAPLRVFEVELSHNIDLALLRLSHARDIGWRNPCLVVLDERDKDRIRRLVEPRLTGAFPRIRRILKVYTANEVGDLYRFLVYYKNLIKELSARE